MMYPLQVESRIMIVQSTGAIKSTIAHKLILHMKLMFLQQEPTRIIYCYNLLQGIYEDIMKVFLAIVPQDIRGEVIMHSVLSCICIL